MADLRLLTTAEQMDNLTRELAELRESFENLQSNTDVFFIVVVGIIIFFMQCGFAFLEAGSVRSKNTTNILIKNILDVFIGGISFWLVGYPLAFGEGNGFLGTTHWASTDLPDEKLALWFFHFVFAATAATIVSGSMAERCSFNAYFIYSIILTGFVYPVIVHWAWSEEGWLGGLGYQDFAGSGVVHLTGGVAALVGAIMLGPRVGRFDPNGKDLRGHSLPLAALGGFILLFGFLAFNGGSQASISQAGDAAAISRVIVNTVLAGCSGGITTLFIHRIRICGKTSHWSFLTCLNGSLTGMVGICAGCNVIQPWSAFVSGIICGPVFLVVHYSLVKLSVDDPLDAVAVHLGGGFWGLICVALFRDEGIIYGGSPNLLAWNMVGALAIIVWAGGLCVIMFGTLRVLGMLRVPYEMELQGLDILKHGEPAYPAESWEEKQYLHQLHHEYGNGTTRNNYLPPHMGVPWATSWPNSPHGGYPVTSSNGYWTMPDPRRSRNPNIPALAQRPLPPNPKMNEFYPSEQSPGFDPSDMRGRRPHKAKGYANDAFEDETSRL